MYRYSIENNYEKYNPNIAVSYLMVNNKGFTDILSINLEYSLKLKKAKNKINEINNDLWEDIKKITNPYEFIYAFNNRFRSNDNRSIALIKPLSRSFFKMIEMIYEFSPSIIGNNNPVYSLHIAEGPGGFIEATRYIRKDFNNVDKAFGITLIDNSRKNVPAWKQSNTFLKHHPEVIITTGQDGTGNIYNIDNINYINKVIITHCIIPEMDKNNKNINNVMDIITADGGFDYSIDYNYQEQASSKLIFSEILTALKYQKIGGSFICKFFDINAYITVEMLYLLYICYENITIYKPYTSRIANSEKYIVCNNFTGIDETFLMGLFNILNEWNVNPNKTINQLFENIPNSFIEKIKSLNVILIDNQIQSINNIFNIISNKKNLNIEWKRSNLEEQFKNAREWCQKYNIPYKK